MSFWQFLLDDPTEILDGFPIADAWIATQGSISGGVGGQSLLGSPAAAAWSAVEGAVDPAGQVAVPVSVASNPDAWTVVGAATIPEALDEPFSPDETDFIQGPTA